MVYDGALKEPGGSFVRATGSTWRAQRVQSERVRVVLKALFDEEERIVLDKAMAGFLRNRMDRLVGTQPSAKTGGSVD
jgi:hypothetical protein